MRAFRTTSGQKFVARAARRLTLMAAAWSTLLACADLEKLDADVCGNGVVEKDEDCEVARDIDGTCGEPGTAVACFYVCDDQTACPSGWSCGAEGVCYQGNGSFYLGAQVPFVGDRAELGDFTADGYDDLAIAADDIIRFRFGPFIETELSESVAGNRGFAAADINGDGADDGVIGSPDSWYILLGSPDLSVGSSFHPSASLGLGRHHLSTTPVVQREFSAQIVPSGMSEGQVCGGGACVALYASLSFLPLSFALDQAAGPLTSAILGERSEDQNDVRVAFAELGAQSIGLAEVQCQGECNVRTFGLGGESTVALADGSRASGVAEDYLGATVALGGPRFFDVEGDGDQDLLVWAEDDAGHKGLGVLYNMDDATSSNPRRLVGTCQATQCDLAGLDTCSDDDTVKVYATEFFSASGVDPGDLLAVGQLDDAGFVDLVTTTGIYLASGSGPSCGFDADFQYRSFGWVPSVGDWTEAVVGDFNGDGIGDVAAFSAGIPQIEIYRGNAAGALTRLVLDTDQAPTAISAGDLDADGADEVVFAVDLDLDDDENDTSDIRVRWGSKAGRELSARSVGQSFRVGPRGLAMGAALTDLQAFDGDAELFIAGTFDSGFAGEGQTTIAVVQGSANRALASSVFSFLSTLVTAYGLDPLVPSMVEPTELDGWERRAWCVGTVAAGRFFDNQGSLDVATFGSLVPVVDGGTNREICDSSELVRFPILEGRRGAGNGNLDAQPPWCEPMPISEICPRSSQMTAINVDDDDYDELIIVAPEPGELGCSIAEDKTSNQILFSVPSGSQLPSASSCVGTFEPSAIGTVAGVLRRIERGSFDAEPGQDLLVTTSSEIAFLPSTGTELATPTAISGLPAEGCSIQASRTVVAGCSAERFLVVLQSCDGQADLALWAVDWADGPIATRATELPIGAVEIAEGAETDVVVGDVNGDGLGDVFARVADSGFFLIASDAPAVGTQDVCQRLD